MSTPANVSESQKELKEEVPPCVTVKTERDIFKSGLCISYEQFWNQNIELKEENINDTCPWSPSSSHY